MYCASSGIRDPSEIFLSAALKKIPVSGSENSVLGQLRNRDESIKYPSKFKKLDLYLTPINDEQSR
jgi:hypothetical protein